MRIAAFVLPLLAALALATTGCGGAGCAHGNHTHATGSTYEESPDYASSCTCEESGQLACTSGGSARN